MRLETLIAHSGEKFRAPDGDVNTPICTSTTFQQKAPAVPMGEFEYSRSGNPTRAALEDALAKLEGAQYGLAFSSGLAAINAAVAILPMGAHVLCMDDVYGGSTRFFKECAPHISVSFADLSIRSATEFLTNETALVWIESPTNPTLKIVDIEKVVKEVKQSKKDCIVLIDSTFLTPVFQNPLKLGADIVLHSVTKYINGHSDVVMGALMTNRKDLYDKLAFFQNSLGSVPSPFDCYLVIRGMKTLYLRVQRQAESAQRIAKYLQSHANVSRVLYPGLETHPNHKVVLSQSTGFGSMISFELKDTSAAEFCKKLKLFILAESLGGVESLVEVPYVMTHSSVPEETRRVLGITPNLIRLSIGIENVEDLIEDLDIALK